MRCWVYIWCALYTGSALYCTSYDCVSAYLGWISLYGISASSDLSLICLFGIHIIYIFLQYVWCTWGCLGIRLITWHCMRVENHFGLHMLSCALLSLVNILVSNCKRIWGANLISKCCISELLGPWWFMAYKFCSFSISLDIRPLSCNRGWVFLLNVKFSSQSSRYHVDGYSFAISFMWHQTCNTCA